MCTLHSLTVHWETKMLNPITTTVVLTTVTMSAYQDQLNAGILKVCEVCKVCSIDFKIRPRVLHTGLLLGH